jgi:putative membrane protein
MRFLSGLFLLTLIVILGLLSYENNSDTVLNAWSWHADVPLPLLVIGVYVLGMLSGWWLVGLAKRSWQRVTEPDRRSA